MVRLVHLLEEGAISLRIVAVHDHVGTKRSWLGSFGSDYSPKPVRCLKATPAGEP